MAGMSVRYTWFWKSLAWGMLLTVVGLTLTPRPPEIGGLPLLSWDKAQHCIAYTALMWTFLHTWEGSHILRWAILLLVVAVGLEILHPLIRLWFMLYPFMLAFHLSVFLLYCAYCLYSDSSPPRTTLLCISEHF